MELHTNQHGPNRVHQGHSTIWHSSTEKEFTSIIEGLRRLDVATGVPDVRTKQAQLRRRLNQLQSSTRVLPLEVLITIFQFISPAVNFTPSTRQFVPAGISNSAEWHVHITLLSPVCWYWRHIIQSTPEFWSTAIIKVKRTPLSVQKKKSLLQLYLDNVSTMFISLELELNFACLPGHSALGNTEFQPILASILDRAQQFKLLSFISPPASWVRQISPKFTNLEDIRIQDVVIDGIILFHGDILMPTTNIPKLRQMYICHSQPRRIPIMLERYHYLIVTVLCMDNMPLDACIYMLTVCPNLIEYRCRPSGSIDSDSARTPRLHFPYMKIFHAPCFFYARISRHLHLPAIETLGLGLISDYSDRNLSPLLLFLRRLPTTWSTLTLTFLDRLLIPRESTSPSNSAISRAAEVTKQVFACIPHHVRSLHLLEISHVGLPIILEALGDTVNQVFIPGLRHIYLETNYLPTVYCMDSDDDYEGGRRRRLSILTNPKLFVKMLWARKAQIEGGEFWLEMNSEDGMYWYHVEKSLRELRSAGVSVRITQGGELVITPEDVLCTPILTNSHSERSDAR